MTGRARWLVLVCALGACERKEVGPAEVDAAVLDAALALPVALKDVRVVQVGAALHVLATLEPGAWTKLDETAGVPTTTATRLLRDDVARQLFAPAALSQLPADGPWRRAEGPRYDVLRWARAPYRTDGAVRLGSGLYMVLAPR